MIEPKVYAKEHIHSIGLLVRNIKKTFLKDQNLRIAILISSVTGTATLTFAWLKSAKKQ